MNKNKPEKRRGDLSDTSPSAEDRVEHEIDKLIKKLVKKEEKER